MKSLTFTRLALITAQYNSVCLAYPSNRSYVEIGTFPAEKAAAPVVLGSASTFGALGATTLSSTGQTVITGDAGTYPGTSITGFAPGVISGSGGGTAARAEAACLIA